MTDELIVGHGASYPNLVRVNCASDKIKIEGKTKSYNITKKDIDKYVLKKDSAMADELKRCREAFESKHDLKDLKFNHTVRKYSHPLAEHDFDLFTNIMLEGFVVGYISRQEECDRMREALEDVKETLEESYDDNKVVAFKLMKELIDIAKKALNNDGGEG